MVEIVKTMGTVFVRIGTAEIHDAEAGTVETVNAAKTARIPMSFVLMTTLTPSDSGQVYLPGIPVPSAQVLPAPKHLIRLLRLV